MAKDISSTQKLLLALISNLSNERKYCYAQNSYLAECLNISAGTVSQAISDLEKKKYLGRILYFKEGSAEVEARFLTVLEKENIEQPSPEKDIPLPLNYNIPPLENLYTPPLENLKDNNKVFNNKEEKESLFFSCPLKTEEKTKVIYSDAELLEHRKQKFLCKIKTYRSENPDKYPANIYNSFFRWWTESNGKKMKFEDQKFFEIGKRLATFWSRISTEEKSKLWQAEKDKPKATLL